MDQTWTAGQHAATALSEGTDTSGLGHPRLALFDRIRALLVATGLPPETPVYDLLLRHVEGDDPVLSAAVAAALAIGTFDLATVSALRQAYCGDQPSGEVAALVEAAHSQAEALGAQLNASADELASYSVVLAAGEATLGAAEPPGATTLATLVARLSAATATMIAATARLNHELAEAAQETGRLHDRLRAAEAAAVTDPLTGVLNRRGALKRLEAAQAAARAAASALSIAMVDIDHFKRINDRYGHVMGDEVLRYVAQHLSQSVAPAGIVGRLGGEEFVVMLPDTRLADATGIVDRARASLAARIIRRSDDGSSMGRISFSAGTALARSDEEPVAIIQRADAALYNAKRMGRDRVVPAP